MNIQYSKDIDEKQKEMKSKIRNYSDNMNFLKEKVKLFSTTMNLLKDNFLISHLNPPFDIIDEVLKDFSNKLNNIILQIKNTILKPITWIMDEIIRNDNKSDEIYNILKQNISEQNEIIKNKNEYQEKKNDKHKSKINNKDPDYNLINSALNENNNQLYTYQIDSIKETIDENYIKIDKIYTDVEIIINNNSQIDNLILVFANSIKKFSENLLELTNKITSELDTIRKNSIVIEDKTDNKVINYNKIEDKNNKNILDISSVNGFQEINIQANVENIIKILINSEYPLKIKEVTRIINFLEININKRKKSEIKNLFLSELYNMCSKRMLIVSNEKNLFHLSNIINSIFLEDLSNISKLNQIIIISNKIKYKDKFLYAEMIKKNSYLKSGLFWQKIIKERLINKINYYIEENYPDKNEEKEKDENKKKERENINSILKKIGIEKEVKHLKKLKLAQLKNLYKYIQENTIIILSEIIPFMYTIFRTDSASLEIIKNYREILKIDNQMIIYINNLTQIKKMKLKQINSSDIINKDKMYNYAIAFSITKKFISKEDFSKLFLLNKKLTLFLKKFMYNNIFQKNNLSLDFHIKFFDEYLEINKIKKENNYNEIKTKINNSFFESSKDNNNIKKKKELIEHDLNRTPFLKQKPEHMESIKLILFSFYFCSNKFEDNQVVYYQGMNTVVSFLYQILNYDEEKTFYYLYGLQFRTNYHLLFIDKLALLNILFSVFEKIIKIYIPEIYYILKSLNIDINYFCSSWFLTLFAGNIEIIDRENPPLLLIYFLEKYCLDGWSAIFNLGLVVLEVCYEKFLKLENEELIKYVMSMISEENIFDNKKFEFCKNIYEKREKLINKDLVDKLIEISKFEYENKFLTNSIGNS